MASAEHLEALLATARTTWTRVPEFLAALLDADVVVSGVQDDSRLRLPLMTGSDGVRVQPFYTSEARLQETLGVIPEFEPRYVVISCRHFFDITRGQHLVLNPHSAVGKEFAPDEVEQLLSGTALLTTRVVESDTTVLVGVPDAVPPGLVEAVVAVCAASPAVAAAHLGWKVVPDTKEMGYLLVFTGAGDLRDALAAPLSTAMALYAAAGPIDVMYAAPGEPHLLADVPPIFRR